MRKLLAASILSYLASCTSSWAGKPGGVSTMTINSEREIKLTLDKRAYQKLKKLLPADKTKTLNQQNYYFDIPTSSGLLLQQSKIVFRARHENNDVFLTLKQGGKKETEAIFARSEYECKLKNSRLFSVLLEGSRSFLSLTEADCVGKDPSSISPIQVLKAFLEGKQSGPLKLIAQNKTVRLSAPMSLGAEELIFALDETSYPGNRMGYELEVELNSLQGARQEQSLYAYLQSKGIAFTPSVQSKAERTFLGNQ
ncbi:MAG: CYTH domain-containing protein [Deltaproteobacteria bacterium]|nr:CYTH domain-containing protein [Deltaproteobacteria bacterium]